MRLVDIESLPVVQVEIGRLRASDMNFVFGPGADDENRTLDASIEKLSIIRPLVCVEVDDWLKILCGHRRWAAAIRLGLQYVPCRVVTGLDPSDEAELLVLDNLRERAGRNLQDEETLWRAENLLRTTWSRRRGGRGDLTGDIKGDTDDLIAQTVGATRTAVRDRAKIFGSHASTPKLQNAVRTRRCARSSAADLVRHAEARIDAGVPVETARAELDDALDGPRKRGTEAQADVGSAHEPPRDPAADALDDDVAALGHLATRHVRHVYDAVVNRGPVVHRLAMLEAINFVLRGVLALREEARGARALDAAHTE